MINIKHDLVGERIQPWASELMNFLVEAWVRKKYEHATNHIIRGLENEEFSFYKDVDNFLLDKTDCLETKVKKHFQIELIMDEIMERVSYNTILNDGNEESKYYRKYSEFVDGIRQGKLVLDCLNHTPKRIK